MLDSILFLMRIKNGCSCRDNMIHTLVLNVKRESFMAFQDLKNSGLENLNAVQIFKNKIDQLITLLKYDDGTHKKSKKIENEIKEQSKLKNLVNLLVKYSSNPTETRAQHLRELAALDENNSEFFREQMDKQNDPKFKFNYPKLGRHKKVQNMEVLQKPF